MAAVTITSQRSNIDGSKREKTFLINIASSGDTLVTGLKLLNSVVFNDTAISKAATSGGTITFTTSGAVTGALIRVQGL